MRVIVWMHIKSRVRTRFGMMPPHAGEIYIGHGIAVENEKFFGKNLILRQHSARRSQGLRFHNHLDRDAAAVFFVIPLPDDLGAVSCEDGDRWRPM